MKAKHTIVYKCCNCGATSYQQVIERSHTGQLQPTGQYKCTGCRNVFASIRAWWEPRRETVGMHGTLQPRPQKSAFSPLAF